METVKKKKNPWLQGLGGTDGREKHRRFGDNENILYDAIKTDTCHYTLVPAHKLYNIKGDSYGILRTWGVYMCQCRFISGNKRPTPWGMWVVGWLGCREQGVDEKSLCLPLSFTVNLKQL